MKKTQTKASVKKSQTTLVQLSEKDLAAVSGGRDRRVIVYN